MPSIARSAFLLALLAAAPVPAAAPTFDTPAKTAYLIDLSSGAVLLDKNADMKMPPASMAKMMTTNVAFELIKRGDLKLDRLCTVRPETWQKWHGPQAGSTMFLSPNEQVSVENLLHGIITLSGNDASVVLAECIAGTEGAFTNVMNDNAKRLGLTNSHFGTANGWPDEGRTYVTARDLATLARAEIENYPDLYKKFYGQKDFTWGKTLGSNKDITQANRNPVLGRVPGADGLKTGHTDEAGYGFTGSAEQNGRRLIMVVAGLDSFNQRIEQSVKLMEWGFNAWQVKPLYKQGAQIGEAQVQLGSSSTVSLVTPHPYSLTMPAGVLSKVTATKIRYQGPLKAPIKKGDHVADLVVSTSDMGEQVMPLVAGEDVGQAGFFGRAWIGLKQLLGMA
jgi:D-alanyl-D-alanine carboxypeptidase (penicillin-binding protein 5/6)